MAIDRFFRNLIDKYLYEISLGLLLIVSVVIRISLASEVDISPDYNDYFGAWVNYYKGTGFFKGLGSVIGDYYAPLNYMYALCSLLPCEPWVPLSIIPCICEYISAYFIYRIFFLLTGQKKQSMFAGVATLFLPYVVMNGSLWKQVDAIYSCVLVISFYYLLVQKYRTSIIWYALCIAIKFQAIIFLPVFVIMYITDGFVRKDNEVLCADGRKGFGFLTFFWIPVVYLALGIPEVLLKNGLRRTYFVYIDQAKEMETEGYGLTAVFPNLYNWGYDNFDELLTVACILTLFAVLVIIACVCYKYRDNIDSRMLVYLGLWTMWTCLMLMPGMHERYDYPMLILLTPFAVLIHKKALWPMIIANLCSVMTYGRAMFRAELFGMQWVSLFYAVAYFWITFDVIKNLKEGNVRVEA